MADLNNIGDKAQQAVVTAKDLGETVKENVGEVGNVVKDKAVEFKDKAAEIGQETLHNALNAQEFLIGLIKDNPYKSIGLAFLAGWLCNKCRKSNDND